MREKKGEKWGGRGGDLFQGGFTAPGDLDSSDCLAVFFFFMCNNSALLSNNGKSRLTITIFL
jgi:hypothetical protein